MSKPRALLPDDPMSIINSYLPPFGGVEGEGKEAKADRAQAIEAMRIVDINEALERMPEPQQQRFIKEQKEEMKALQKYHEAHAHEARMLLQRIAKLAGIADFAKDIKDIKDIKEGERHWELLHKEANQLLKPDLLIKMFDSLHVITFATILTDKKDMQMLMSIVCTLKPNDQLYIWKLLVRKKELSLVKIMMEMGSVIEMKDDDDALSKADRENTMRNLLQLIDRNKRFDILNAIFENTYFAELFRAVSDNEIVVSMLNGLLKDDETAVDAKKFIAHVNQAKFIERIDSSLMRAIRDYNYPVIYAVLDASDAISKTSRARILLFAANTLDLTLCRRILKAKVIADDKSDLTTQEAVSDIVQSTYIKTLTALLLSPSPKTIEFIALLDAFEKHALLDDVQRNIVATLISDKRAGRKCSVTEEQFYTALTASAASKSDLAFASLFDLAEQNLVPTKFLDSKKMSKLLGELVIQNNQYLYQTIIRYRKKSAYEIKKQTGLDRYIDALINDIPQSCHSDDAIIMMFNNSFGFPDRMQRIVNRLSEVDAHGRTLLHYLAESPRIHSHIFGVIVSWVPDLLKHSLLQQKDHKGIAPIHIIVKNIDVEKTINLSRLYHGAGNNIQSQPQVAIPFDVRVFDSLYQCDDQLSIDSFLSSFYKSSPMARAYLLQKYGFNVPEITSHFDWLLRHGVTLASLDYLMAKTERHGKAESIMRGFLRVSAFNEKYVVSYQTYCTLVQHYRRINFSTLETASTLLKGVPEFKNDTHKNMYLCALHLLNMKNAYATLSAIGILFELREAHPDLVQAQLDVLTFNEGYIKDMTKLFLDTFDLENRLHLPNQQALQFVLSLYCKSISLANVMRLAIKLSHENQMELAVSFIQARLPEALPDTSETDALLEELYKNRHRFTFIECLVDKITGVATKKEPIVDKTTGVEIKQPPIIHQMLDFYIEHNRSGLVLKFSKLIFDGYTLDEKMAVKLLVYAHKNNDLYLFERTLIEIESRGLNIDVTLLIAEEQFLKLLVSMLSEKEEKVEKDEKQIPVRALIAEQNALAPPAPEPPNTDSFCEALLCAEIFPEELSFVQNLLKNKLPGMQKQNWSADTFSKDQFYCLLRELHSSEKPNRQLICKIALEILRALDEAGLFAETLFNFEFDYRKEPNPIELAYQSPPFENFILFLIDHSESTKNYFFDHYGPKFPEGPPEVYQQARDNWFGNFSDDLLKKLITIDFKISKKDYSAISDIQKLTFNNRNDINATFIPTIFVNALNRINSDKSSRIGFLSRYSYLRTQKHVVCHLAALDCIMESRSFDLLSAKEKLKYSELKDVIKKADSRGQFLLASKFVICVALFARDEMPKTTMFGFEFGLVLGNAASVKIEEFIKAVNNLIAAPDLTFAAKLDALTKLIHSADCSPELRKNLLSFEALEFMQKRAEAKEAKQELPTPSLGRPT